MPHRHASYAKQLTWTEAFTVLRNWIPGFCAIPGPETLSFDRVVKLMEATPGGLQPLWHSLPDDDGVFIEVALHRLNPAPSEVVIIPECGTPSRCPFILSHSGIRQFIEDYEQASPRMGLFDGTSDILFAFDTSDMLLIDHDERVWISPASNISG